MPTTCATPASINSMIVSMIEEVNCGEMPGTGAWIHLPIQEGTAMTLAKNFERSAVITPTRQGGRQIGGTSSTEGTIITPVTLDPGVILLIEAAIGGTFTLDVAKAGLVFRTFTIEFRYLTAPPTGYTYERFLGCVINTMTIDLPTTGGATANFGILGRSMQVAATASALDDTAPFPTGIPMAGSADASEAFINAVPLIGLASATINTTNNAETKFAVGSSSADHVTLGDFDATADLTIYYRGPEQTNHYIAEDRVDIRIRLANSAGETMDFRLPEAVFTTADKGNDGPSMTEAITAFGELDAFEGTKLTVDRGTAVTEMAREGGPVQPGQRQQYPGQVPGQYPGQPPQYPGQPPPQRRQESALGEDRA
jgi:hypothetical protein